MSKTSHAFPNASPPGQEDRSARLAASAEVGQAEGFTCSELFSSLAILVALLITCVALFAMVLANSFLLGVLLKALFLRLTA